MNKTFRWILAAAFFALAAYLITSRPDGPSGRGQNPTDLPLAGVSPRVDGPGLGLLTNNTGPAIGFGSPTNAGQTGSYNFILSGIEKANWDTDPAWRDVNLPESRRQFQRITPEDLQ
jgi:hypothetical protein